MAKKNEIISYRNYTAAVVAPGRSEIRIEIPSFSIPLPSKEFVLKAWKYISYFMSTIFPVIFFVCSYMELQLPIYIAITMIIAFSIGIVSSSYILIKEFGGIKQILNQ